MRSCNCNCNAEHYVVRPNIPTYDWSYEYNTDSNAKRCKCDDNMELLIDSINAIRNNVSSLLDIMRNNNPSGINTAVIENRLKALEDKINEVDTIQSIDLTLLAGDVLAEMERHPEQYNFANIGSNDLTELQNKVSELESKVNNLSSSTEIETLINKTDAFETRIVELESRISGIPSSTEIETLINKVNTLETKIIENTGGEINVALDGKTLVITGDNIKVVV